MNSHILISAGEPSGDILAAGLLKSLMKQRANLTAYGMGGPALKAAGADILVDIASSGSIMGFSELGGRLKKTVSALKILKEFIKKTPPSLLVCVDFGDFNLRLAAYATKHGVPVYYFVPPKVWAWRKSRLSKLRRFTKKICVIYPYEKEFLEREGIKHVYYAGNPWADEIANLREQPNYQENRKQYLTKIGLNPEKKVLAVFPGSRVSEIKAHMAVAKEAIAKLRLKHQDIQAIISVAPGISVDDLGIASESGVIARSGESREILSYADAGMIKSGTSNIEAALAGLPFFMFFKVSAISAFIVRRLVTLQEFSPVNIMRSKTIPEVIQEDFTVENVTNAAEKVLFSETEKQNQAQGFKEIRSALEPVTEGETSYDGAARLAIEEIGKSPRSAGLYKRVLSYIRPYTGVFSLGLLCMVIFGATDGALPILLKHVLDGVFQDKDKTLLLLIPGIVILFALIRGLTDFGQQYLMAKVGHGVVKDLRNSLNQHVLKLSNDFFLSNSSANLLSRITSDVVLVRTLLTDAFASVLRDGVRIVALIGSAVYLDPTLAVIALIAFPIGIYPVYKFGRRMRRLSKRGQEEIGSLSSMLQESITGHRVVKAFGREEFEKNKFEVKNQELTKTFLKSERVRALTGPVNEVIASLAIAGVIYYGGVSVISEVRTQGDFLAFLIALFLLYDPFKKLTRMNSTIQQGMSGAERIFEVLDTEPTIHETHNPRRLNSSNKIEFTDVHFSYGPGRPVLRGINLEVPEGKKVAIVGLSGAGKTTLIDLIPRFIEPKNGEVRIGGISLKEASIEELRSRIALVGQHTFLFNDSIANNILYGRAGASMEDIQAAARAAFAHDFIMKLKDGYQTIVGEGGYSLSGGERQRIAIARAILKNAPILLLDEATASLDNQSEREVQRALEALEHNRTCVIIAHRLSTVQNADKIVVMKAGEIVEEGKHEELLKLGGEYSKLHSLQFERSGRPHEAAA